MPWHGGGRRNGVSVGIAGFQKIMAVHESVKAGCSVFDSFLVALNAIMPTFLLLAFGYFLKHKNFVSSEFLKQTNTLTFKFFLPFLLFNNIYKTEITEPSTA